MRRIALLIISLVAGWCCAFSKKKYVYTKGKKLESIYDYSREKSFGVTMDTISEADTEEISNMFFVNFAPYCADDGVQYPVSQKLECLISRGLLVPLDGSNPIPKGSAKYYTTEKRERVLFHFPDIENSYYIIRTRFTAPIYSWDTVILTELVKPNERGLSNARKLELLLRRGVLKRLKESDDLSALNAADTITYRQNPAFVDSMNKEIYKSREAEAEAVRAAMSKIASQKK